jgi:plasmid stabilization system protein ParE
VGQTRSLKLRYTLPALADLSAILDYIAAHSLQGARRVQPRIKTLTDLLLLHPHIGRRTNDPAIRRMTTTPYSYLVFDEAKETEIIIHASGMRPVTPPECLAQPVHITKRRLSTRALSLLCATL